MLLTDLPNSGVPVDFRPIKNLHLLSSVLRFTQTTRSVDNNTCICLANSVLF